MKYNKINSQKANKQYAKGRHHTKQSRDRIHGEERRTKKKITEIKTRLYNPRIYKNFRRWTGGNKSVRKKNMYRSRNRNRNRKPQQMTIWTGRVTEAQRLQTEIMSVSRTMRYSPNHWRGTNIEGCNSPVFVDNLSQVGKS